MTGLCPEATQALIVREGLSSRPTQVALNDDLLILLILQAPDEIAELVVLRGETLHDLVSTVRCTETGGCSERNILADLVSIVRPGVGAIFFLRAFRKELGKNSRKISRLGIFFHIAGARGLSEP